MKCYKLLPNFSINLPIPEIVEGVVVITGNNGSGKTTLLRLLSDKYDVNDNEIVEIINKSNLFFELNNLSKDETLANNIQLIKSLCSIDDELFDMFINVFQLKSRLKIKAKKCSAGEIKKLLIALNLSQNMNPIYFLDEPFENLDLRSKNSLIEILDKMFNKKNGKTLLVTAHRVFELDSIKSKRIDLGEGKVS